MGLGSDDEESEEGFDQETDDCQPTTDNSHIFLSLKLTNAANDKLEQAVALLKTELPDVRDKRELLGLVVERLCEEYL